MSIFDKLKNALFEEEYVEVEEKPKSKPKRDKVKIVDNSVEKLKKEKPIAKKIVLPEKNESNSHRVDNNRIDDDNDEVIEDDLSVKDNDFTEKNDFKIMNDDDFKVDEVRYREAEPKIVKVIERENSIENSNRVNENLYHNSSKAENTKKPYGLDDDLKINVHQYGSYEKKEDRGYFKPSPIISPIYGILDKNYKKEEIVTRKEVRLTSSYAREKLNVDDVRKKAYGALEDDIEKVSFEEKKNSDATFEIEEDNLLVDLSSDIKKPAVKEVTMGDALEYFQDLGLEYNVDYVDAAKRATGRRAKDKYEDIDTIDTKPEEKVKVDVEVNTSVNIKEQKKEETESDDDNLFDLIDSMYKEED